MAFDGIVTKKIVDELVSIIGYKIDKIYQPDKNTIILGLYGNFSNIALLSCISSNNYRIHLTNHMLKNPTIAPNFCMFLRKHILGMKIKNIYTKNLERIVYIELENSENPDKVINKTLVIELMGKHSNIILLDENGLILDALRHTSVEENAQRDIYPTARYSEPISNKLNFLEVRNFDKFYNAIKDQLPVKDSDYIYEDLINVISNTFNGFSSSNLKYMSDKILSSISEKYMSSKLFAHKIYDVLNEYLNSDKVSVEVTAYKNNLPKDYALSLLEEHKQFSLNFALDDLYFEKESSELFNNFKNSLLNLILSTLKKYEKRLDNIDDKLLECKNMDKYKLYGELITANLYKIPNYNVSNIELENYYDNNTLLNIPLNKKFSPQHNANLYYKKYNKLKNALEIVSEQKQETLDDINYIESIIYENDIFKVSNSKKFGFNKNKSSSKKPKKMTSNKFVKFNPLKYVIDGYTIYVGRNNKENDYLTNKFASKNDIWFHTKDIHGSHVILKSPPAGETIPDSIIFEAAKLAVQHSKAKNSSNVPVDYCQVQFVKKVPGNKPGLVIYRNNKTIYVF